MNSGPGRSHFCRQSAFAQVLFVHQVVHFQGHGPLERCGLNLFDHFLFSEEIPEVAAAMFVSRLNYMTVSFLIRLSKRDLQLFRLHELECRFGLAVTLRTIAEHAEAI